MAALYQGMAGKFWRGPEALSIAEIEGTNLKCL